jgi:glyoxylase-like metal-dependent hydrolase (beta-lactamase superfamily II)
MRSPGSIVPLRLTDFVYPLGHPSSGPGVVFGYAVAHAEGVLLYDTGFGTDNEWVERELRPVTRDPRTALRAAGIEPADVTFVVNSHLHFDHCGGNALFAGVPIIAQRAEYDAAQETGYTVREWVDFPGAVYELVDGDVEPVTGIRVLATPGHTVGHQSLSVQTSGGVVVLAGHAIYSAAEYAGAAPAEPLSDVGLRSADRLHRLDPVRVFFSHDAEIWERRPGNELS